MTTKSPVGALLNDLATLRCKAGLTLQQVAERMGTNSSAISRFENSARYQRTPTLDTLLRYTKAIGADLRATPSQEQP